MRVLADHGHAHVLDQQPADRQKGHDLDRRHLLGPRHAADALGQRAHFTYVGGGITDDHTPLNEIGIPVIDLIDFDFPPWHTAGDTVDKISAESLEIVGRVALYDLVQFELK